MRANQKYFPLFDGAGKLTNKFLIVSNMRLTDPAHVIEGNERVVRPRLADAQFFFDTDKKTKLEDRVPQLATVTYHNRLGSQLDRVTRVRGTAKTIASRLGADAALADRAAHLAKADLLTLMVGEFPELQGLMGKYYARHDGEPEAVAQAIESHYWPRFAGDILPSGPIGACVALADRLDTLVGIYGIGLVPTGEKDPFGLRRAALGVLRIIIEKRLQLDLSELLQTAAAQFPDNLIPQTAIVELRLFILDRLKNFLREKEHEQSAIDAVVQQSTNRLDQVTARLDAVKAFRALPEAKDLAAANKRIQNILKKTHDYSSAEPDPGIMTEEAERALFRALKRIAPESSRLVLAEDFVGALSLLAGIRNEVDVFFSDVLVMDDDPKTQRNRLTLLQRLGLTMNEVADISKLAS
jgi:glycyl-tRNA synthetase beta chain